MNFAVVIERLEAALKGPLPGPQAQARMAPRPRRQWPRDFNPARIRHAAGLLLVYPIADRAHVVLTLRAESVRHGGQVSLPGGVAEPGESYPQAALREANEEVALDEPVRVLGTLTPLDIPVSGFRLHPVVAAAERRPTLRPADAEVARILEVDVADLSDPAQQASITVMRGDREVIAPAFAVAGVKIWGATAMVLAEFLTLLGFAP